MDCGSVPKHGTEIVGILWRFLGLSVIVQKLVVLCVWEIKF